MGHVLMAQELVIAPAGLWTDPNPLSAAPAGAMTEALNVVIARPGVVRPRPGLDASTVSSMAVDADVVRIIPFESDWLILAKNHTTGTGYAYWLSANDDMVQAGSFIGASSAWGLTTGRVHAAIAGGNIYVTCDEGVFRASAPGDDNAYRAGLPRPAQAQVANATTGGVNYPVTANSAVAWRLCSRATAGRLPVRSAPSGRIVQRSYTGASNKLNTLTFANTDTNVTEIYRSNALAPDDADEPTDEMVLAGTAAASAASFTDDEAFSDFYGPALYTNATQGGFDTENGITPLCRDVATFREMLFFGAAERAPSLTFEVLGFGDAWRGTNNATANRLTSFTITGDSTNTSTTVSGVSATDIAKVRAGQRVYLDSSNPTTSDANFAADVLVVSVNTGAGTFVISSAATATNVGLTIRLSDWIQVAIVDNSGTTTERVYCDDASGTNYIDAREFRASTTADVRGPQQMAYELSDELNGKATITAFGDGVTGSWTFIAETWAADVTSMTVKTSNASAISSRIDATTGTTVTRSGSVATLAWSKPGEPEHVPPGYFKEIGESICPIERIIPTRDALFVFKTDGVWRVSGYSPDTLQIDEFDRTMRLAHPNAACEWSGRIAAWTNKGVLLISDGGAEEISQPVADIFLDKLDDIYNGGSDEVGVSMCAWIERGLLLIGIPATSAGYASRIYCWCERTRAWSRWSTAWKVSAMAQSLYGQAMIFGTKAESGALAKILTAVDGGADITYAVTIASVSSTTVTISAGSGWVPAIGDVVASGATNYAITAVASVTSFTVHTTGAAAGAGTAYQRPAAELTFTVRDGENAGASKLFREATLIYGSTSGVAVNDNSFTTDRSQAAGTTTASIPYTESDVPLTVRTRIPRESRRCARLLHTLEIPSAIPDWTLHGVSYVYEPLSTRFRDAS
jgi:hypothetical protein